MTPIAQAWCVIKPDGRIEASSSWETEDDAWRIVLGWPTCGEVRHAKENGWRCIRVAVIPALEVAT